MGILILGLVLFLGIHTLTTMRVTRAAMVGRLGEGPYKGLYSVVSAIGLVLIVWGFGRYRSAGYIQVWDPPFAIFHPIEQNDEWAVQRARYITLESIAPAAMIPSSACPLRQTDRSGSTRRSSS